jgi:NhaP-type Na+/H+ or K+/H+ antiporter
MTVIVGILWSVLFYIDKGAEEEELNMYRFSHAGFFHFIFPAMIYNYSFNMHRKSFFSNTGNILILGPCVAFFSLLFYFVCSYLVLNYFSLSMTKYVDEGEHAAGT